MGNLYTFQINDRDALSMTFSCVAGTTEEAINLAKTAGYRDFFLLEVLEHKFSIDLERAQDELLKNPLLGPRWRPLVDALEDSFQHMEPGNFWTLTWHSGHYEESPFMQALHESDGSILVEIGPANLLSQRPLGQDLALEFLGWNPPGPDIRLPNYRRFIDPGWNMWGVGAICLQSLLILGLIDETSIFSVQTSMKQKFDPKSHLVKLPVRVEGVHVDLAYSLPHRRNPTSPRKRATSPASDQPKRPTSRTLYPIFAGESRGLGTAFSFNSVWPPKAPNEVNVSKRQLLQLDLPPDPSRIIDSDVDVREDWHAEFEWAWGAVAAARLLADPSASIPFPRKPPASRSRVDSLQNYWSSGYWSSLWFLCRLRLGWSRPAWGFAHWLGRKADFRDPTLEFIRQHFPIPALRKFAAWTEGLPEERLSDLFGSHHRAASITADKAVSSFLARYGTFEGGGFVTSRESELNDGGWDSLHLSAHLPRDWDSDAFTYRVEDALPAIETAPNRKLMVLKSAENWMQWLRNWASLTAGSMGIGWVGTPGEPLCDLYVEPIGFIGSFRAHIGTGLPYATSEKIHLLGNPGAGPN